MLHWTANTLLLDVNSYKQRVRYNWVWYIFSNNATLGYIWRANRYEFKRFDSIFSTCLHAMFQSLTWFQNLRTILTIICRVLLYDIFEDIIINVFSNRSRLILTLFWSINFLFDDNYQQFCHQVCGRVGSCLIVSFKYNATVVCGYPWNIDLRFSWNPEVFASGLIIIIICL